MFSAISICDIVLHPLKLKSVWNTSAVFFSVVSQSKSYAYSLNFFISSLLSMEIKYLQKTDPIDSVELHPGQ